MIITLIYGSPFPPLNKKSNKLLWLFISQYWLFFTELRDINLQIWFFFFSRNCEFISRNSDFSQLPFLFGGGNWLLSFISQFWEKVRIVRKKISELWVYISKVCGEKSQNCEFISQKSVEKKKSELWVYISKICGEKSQNCEFISQKSVEKKIQNCEFISQKSVEKKSQNCEFISQKSVEKKSQNCEFIFKKSVEKFFLELWVYISKVCGEKKVRIVSL